MSDKFTDRDGDTFEVIASGVGEGALLDLTTPHGGEVTFYASDALEIIGLIQRAAVAAA